MMRYADIRYYSLFLLFHMLMILLMSDVLFGIVLLFIDGRKPIIYFY